MKNHWSSLKLKSLELISWNSLKIIEFLSASNDYQWFSLIFLWFQWASMIFNDFQWVSLIFQWISMILQWVSMSFNDVHWFPLILRDFHWNSIMFCLLRLCVCVFWCVFCFDLFFFVFVCVVCVCLCACCCFFCFLCCFLLLFFQWSQLKSFEKSWKSRTPEIQSPKSRNPQNQKSWKLPGDAGAARSCQVFPGAASYQQKADRSWQEVAGADRSCKEPSRFRAFEILEFLREHHTWAGWRSSLM